MLKKLLCVLAVAVMATGAQAAHLLDIDLTVPNRITITSTGNPSLATASGSDTTGIYFEGFYGGPGGSLSASLDSGDITNFLNPTDNSPSLFRGGGGSDPGLNLWSFSSDATVDFTAGTQAFTGSGSWDLDPPEYADMVAGASGGAIYFPADTEDDVAGATYIGDYVVTVPEPAALTMISMLGLALLGIRKR